VKGSAPLQQAQAMAGRLARQALAMGGREILAEIEDE
jgi:hypothetical protein